MNFKPLCSIILLLICFSHCSKDGTSDDHNIQIPSQQDSQTSASDNTVTPRLERSDFKTIEWTELIPKSDLDAILSPPSYLNDIQDGSVDDQLASAITPSNDSTIEDAYQNALVSTTIIPEMNNHPIRIPGFIVPLEFDDNQAITAFFLVPYFGACIHVPPPPPNQIIYVESSHGIKLDVSYDAFWISGVLKTSLIENDLATAAYTMQLEFIELYQL